MSVVVVGELPGKHGSFMTAYETVYREDECFPIFRLKYFFQDSVTVSESRVFYKVSTARQRNFGEIFIQTCNYCEFSYEKYHWQSSIDNTYNTC